MKFKQIIVIILIAFIGSTSKGMDQYFSAEKIRNATNTFKKIVFPTKAHIVPFSAAFSVTIGKLFITSLYFLDKNIKQLNHEKINDQSNKKQYEIDEFIYKELKNSNIEHPEKIDIIFVSLEFSYAGALFNQAMFIDRKAREDFIKAGILHAPLKTMTKFIHDGKGNVTTDEIWHTVNLEESQKLSKEISAIIQHEAGHLKANDAKRNILAGAGIASASYLSTVELLKKVNSFIPSKKAKAVITAMSSIPLYVINRISRNTYSRHREICADEQIPNKKNYLEGSITFFEKMVEQEKEDILKGKKPDVYNNKFSYLWHMDHPTNQWRLNRFKERLNNLESKESCDQKKKI